MIIYETINFTFLINKSDIIYVHNYILFYRWNLIVTKSSLLLLNSRKPYSKVIFSVYGNRLMKPILTLIYKHAWKKWVKKNSQKKFWLTH